LGLGKSSAGQPKAGVDDAFIREVAAQEPSVQIKFVIAKLKELNPGYDGTEKHKIDDNAVVELELFADGFVTDISPLRALPRLRQLACDDMMSTRRPHSKLTDLAALKGMPLTALIVNRSDVRDLSPLQGMPLGYLNCGGTSVSDLSPLRGMPLHELGISDCPITDLSPLRGMPLKRLTVNHTKVTDFSPLQGMPLTELSLDFNPQRDTAFLRSLSMLTRINGLPAAEFWKRVGAGGVPQAK